MSAMYGREHAPQPLPRHGRHESRQQECAEHEQGACHAVVMARVDGRMGTRATRLGAELRGLIDRAEGPDAVERGSPGRPPARGFRVGAQRTAVAIPQPVPPLPAGRAAAPVATRHRPDKAIATRTPSAGTAFTPFASRFDSSTTPGQTITAQRGDTDERRDRRGTRRQTLCNECEHRDRDERQWPVPEHERPAHAPCQAAARDVVRLVRGESRVRHEDLGGHDGEERPDGCDLDGERCTVSVLGRRGVTLRRGA